MTSLRFTDEDIADKARVSAATLGSVCSVDQESQVDATAKTTRADIEKKQLGTCLLVALREWRSLEESLAVLMRENLTSSSTAQAGQTEERVMELTTDNMALAARVAELEREGVMLEMSLRQVKGEKEARDLKLAKVHESLEDSLKHMDEEKAALKAKMATAKEEEGEGPEVLKQVCKEMAILDAVVGRLKGLEGQLGVESEVGRTVGERNALEAHVEKKHEKDGVLLTKMEKLRKEKDALEMLLRQANGKAELLENERAQKESFLSQLAKLLQDREMVEIDATNKMTTEEGFPDRERAAGEAGRKGDVQETKLLKGLQSLVEENKVLESQLKEAMQLREKAEAKVVGLLKERRRGEILDDALAGPDRLHLAKVALAAAVQPSDEDAVDSGESRTTSSTDGRRWRRSSVGGDKGRAIHGVQEKIRSLEEDKNRLEEERNLMAAECDKVLAAQRRMRRECAKEREIAANAKAVARAAEEAREEAEGELQRTRAAMQAMSNGTSLSEVAALKAKFRKAWAEQKKKNEASQRAALEAATNEYARLFQNVLGRMRDRLASVVEGLSDIEASLVLSGGESVAFQRHVEVTQKALQSLVRTFGDISGAAHPHLAAAANANEQPRIEERKMEEDPAGVKDTVVSDSTAIAVIPDAAPEEKERSEPDGLSKVESNSTALFKKDGNDEATVTAPKKRGMLTDDVARLPTEPRETQQASSQDEVTTPPDVVGQLQREVLQLQEEVRALQSGLLAAKREADVKGEAMQELIVRLDMEVDGLCMSLRGQNASTITLEDGSVPRDEMKPARDDMEPVIHAAEHQRGTEAAVDRPRLKLSVVGSSADVERAGASSLSGRKASGCVQNSAAAKTTEEAKTSFLQSHCEELTAVDLENTVQLSALSGKISRLKQDFFLIAKEKLAVISENRRLKDAVKGVEANIEKPMESPCAEKPFQKRLTPLTGKHEEVDARAPLFPKRKDQNARLDNRRIAGHESGTLRARSLSAERTSNGDESEPAHLLDAAPMGVGGVGRTKAEPPHACTTMHGACKKEAKEHGGTKGLKGHRKGRADRESSAVRVGQAVVDDFFEQEVAAAAKTEKPNSSLAVPHRRPLSTPSPSPILADPSFRVSAVDDPLSESGSPQQVSAGDTPLAAQIHSDFHELASSASAVKDAASAFFNNWL